MNQEMVDMSIGYGLRRARVALGIFGFLGALLTLDNENSILRKVFCFAHCFVRVNVFYVGA